MSREATVRLPARRMGRRGPAVRAPVAAGAPDAARSPTPDRIPRLARVLALAHHWQGLIREGVVRDQADLARLVGVSRARVTQVMNLLWLAPDIQEGILFLQTVDVGSDPVLHRDLLAIAAEPVWSMQRARRGAGIG